MYLHYIRKIINEVLDQLKWFEKANVRPNTVIPYPRANGLTHNEYSREFVNYVTFNELFEP